MTPEPGRRDPAPVQHRGRTDWTRYAPCPRCGAGVVYQKCIAANGAPRYTPHPERPTIQ